MIGSGAREHALVWRLARDAGPHDIVCAPGNAGIESLARVAPVDPGDPEAVFGLADREGADLTVVGPELPLTRGVADLFASRGGLLLGPSRLAAELESSKAFAKGFMARHGVPTARYQVCETPDIALAVLATRQFGYPVVIKADGLAAGKGVVIATDQLNASLAIRGMMVERRFGDAGARIVIEEFMQGREVSVFALTDGHRAVLLPTAEDHKRAFDGDKGPNTGGMGSYSFPDHSLPFLEKSDLAEAKSITEKVAAALRKETGLLYKGVMYGGFMKTAQGVKLIEYNARFGDPEVMNVLPIIESDFAEVCKAITAGTLHAHVPKFKHLATVCKYAVPKGYPTDPIQGQQIDVSALKPPAKFYFGSVEALNAENTLLRMGRSRAVACVGIGKTIREAERMAEKTVSAIKGPVFHRKDIATPALLRKRVEHVKRILARR